MGLPIFVAPPSPELGASVIDKTGVPRSAIRRQRTLRGNRARSGYESRRRRLLAIENAADFHNIPSTDSRDDETEEPEHVSPPAELDILPTGYDMARLNRMRVHNERMRLHQSFERRNPLNIEIDGPLMPPVPESRDYTALEERRREIHQGHIRDLRRMARRQPAPTPPYTEADIDRRVTYYYPRAERSRNSLPPPSRNTPPDDIGFNFEDHYRTMPTSAEPILFSHASRHTSPQNTSRAAESYERDRWVVRRMRSQLRGPMDGLGDRERSLSPDGGSAAWDTLLRTITPDPQPPSASSSFASSSASARVAASSTAPASANTSMTSQGVTDGSRILIDCDISESSDIDEDSREDREHFWRAYGNHVTEQPNRSGQNGGSGETDDLEGMQGIILRLAAREDIPDQWWAGAGLRREPTS